MADAPDQPLLEALLDSWDRNNTILLSLLRALPEGGLDARAMEGGPRIAKPFRHIHYLRLVLVIEVAREFARKLPEEEWVVEHDSGRIAQMPGETAKAVWDAVTSRVEAGRDMNFHYDHPIVLAPAHALARRLPSRSDEAGRQMAGRAMTDKQAAAITWDVWMRKR